MSSLVSSSLLTGARLTLCKYAITAAAKVSIDESVSVA